MPGVIGNMFLVIANIAFAILSFQAKSYESACLNFFGAGFCAMGAITCGLMACDNRNRKEY